jgi:hypothetical protein
MIRYAFTNVKIKNRISTVLQKKNLFYTSLESMFIISFKHRRLCRNPQSGRWRSGVRDDVDGRVAGNGVSQPIQITKARRDKGFVAGSPR